MKRQAPVYFILFDNEKAGQVSHVPFQPHYEHETMFHWNRPITSHQIQNIASKIFLVTFFAITHLLCLLYFKILLFIYLF